MTPAAASADVGIRAGGVGGGSGWGVGCRRRHRFEVESCQFEVSGYFFYLVCHPDPSYRQGKLRRDLLLIVRKTFRVFSIMRNNE